MTINDAVFGELEYNYAWFKDTNIEFCGQEAEIALMISGEQIGEFSEKQYASYKSLIQNWNKIQQDVLQPILDYYDENYDAGLNENFPLIESVEQLIDYINLAGISVPNSKGLEGRYIGLTFDCTWDEENGLGLLLIDEEVARVGYQDTVM